MGAKGRLTAERSPRARLAHETARYCGATLLRLNGWSTTYLDGKIRRIETVHGVHAAPEIVLRVPNAHSVRREAVFSVGVPFGSIQRQAKALLLLSQPVYESGGLNFGHYNQVRLYQDQLQDDGRFSLMVVALDENLVPWKFGYMLDVDPAHLDEAHLMFMPPMATGVDHERQLVRWRKNADPLNTTTGTSTCDFKSPPYTECGLYPDKGGIFSWINVWRKGQLFHTPGAFLPARTAGANPLMALPDAQIELVGHDDPKGFAPFNFARHRFLRFQRHSHDLEPLFRTPGRREHGDPDSRTGFFGRLVAGGYAAEFRERASLAYGSDGVEGYQQALALRAEGKNPLHQGESAFQVTRWR